MRVAITGPRPEAPFAALELLYCFKEVLAAKVGPEHFGEDEFGIGDLPQQEVRDSILPDVRITRSGSASSG